MAAATVTSSVQTRQGRKRVIYAQVTAPANNDTMVTGLASIDHINFGFPGGNLAAADAVSYTVSGGTITFKVVGTARDLSLEIIGL